MSSFAPKCPTCNKTDQVVIFLEDGKYYLDRYYCKRCKKVFEANKGYPVFTSSTYMVTGGSVNWSGSPTYSSY
jgi:transposase-like protein